MDNTNFDNSAASDIDSNVIWQYDQSVHLCGIVDLLKNLYKVTTQDFWDEWLSNVVGIDTADDFGLSVWGNMLGVPRPSLVIEGETVSMSSPLYRKVLKGRIKLLASNASIPAYVEYIYDVFDGKLNVIDTLAMGLKFTVKTGSVLTAEQAAFIEQYPDIAFIYPSGVKSSDKQPLHIFCLANEQNDHLPCRTSETRIGSQLDHGIIAWGNNI